LHLSELCTCSCGRRSPATTSQHPVVLSSKTYSLRTCCRRARVRPCCRRARVGPWRSQAHYAPAAAPSAFVRGAACLCEGDVLTTLC
jgi:hypothetical protein